MPDSPPGDLRLVDLTKRFGAMTAVDGIDLTVPAGSFFALLGPSGCGKTTTLRMVAGLEEPTAGAILLGDEDISGLRPYSPVNTVFQNYALFPHLDVFENVAFGLRRRGQPRVKEQVEEMLQLVELSGFGRRRPGQLSGGQQQRVALARALINRPQLLLLDEPLGALDLKLRRQMQLELKRIQTEVGLTFVHVTHDQEEAMTMADTIAVMNGGRIEQLGEPAELYDSPATVFVANFLGQSNLVGARVTGRSGEDLLVDVHGRQVVVPQQRARTTGTEVFIGVRPEKIHVAPVSKSPDRAGDNALDGTVVDASFIGVSTQYLVRTAWGQDLVVFAQNDGTAARLRPGDAVELRWQPRHTFCLDGSGDIDAGVVIDESAADPDPRLGAGVSTRAEASGASVAGARKRRGKALPYWLLAPGLLWLGFFFVVPMLTLASTSLQTGDVYAGFSLTWRWANYSDALTNYAPQFIRSFQYAGFATLLALAIAYPLAYAIAFKAGRWQNVLLVLVIAPFFTSFLVRTLAWQTMLTDDGFVVGLLRGLHLLADDGRLLATPVAVVAGLTYNFLPFMTLPLYASLEKIDRGLIEAAGDLYSTPFAAFRKVTWPMSLPGVVGGTLLTFIPAAGDFVNVQFLGSPRQQMIGNVIQSRFLVASDYPVASALSFALMLAILVLVIVYIRRAGTEELLT